MYLQLRQALIEGDIDRAADLSATLSRLSLDRGRIPLSQHDLASLKVVLRFWREVLCVTPSALPVRVELLAGRTQDELTAISPQPVGDLAGYRVRVGETIAFQVTNPTDRPAYVYLVSFDTSGRMNILRLWGDDELMFSGLPSESSNTSLPFNILGGDEGIEELWVYYSPKRFSVLLSPLAIGTRSALAPISRSQAASLVLQKIHLHEELETSRTDGTRAPGSSGAPSPAIP